MILDSPIRAVNVCCASYRCSITLTFCDRANIDGWKCICIQYCCKKLSPKQTFIGLSRRVAFVRVVVIMIMTIRVHFYTVSNNRPFTFVVNVNFCRNLSVYTVDACKFKTESHRNFNFTTVHIHRHDVEKGFQFSPTFSVMLHTNPHQYARILQPRVWAARF